MIVVADASPLVVLAKIGLTEILPKLFGKVIIPLAVYDELLAPRRPENVRNYFATRPTWIDIRTPHTTLVIPDLHEGETAALALAIELHADLVLVDERAAYRAAVERHLAAVGTIRVLERAAEAGLVDLAVAFEAVKQTDFWLPAGLLDGRLKIFQQQQAGGGT
jgi:predicted nucleic acid-binding protein